MDNSTDSFPLDFRSFSVIAFAALLLALPMLIYGPMPGSWDSYEHLNFAHHFSDQFWAGEGYPRWLMGINHGLGSPTLFVYPPLPSYVYTVFAPVANLWHFDAFKAGEFLALFGSGISAFVWLSTMANPGGALVGAILYMLVPYHLSIDYYDRSALSECWALVWMPLVLYFSTKATRQPNRSYIIGIGIAYAMLILSHLITVAMFSLIPLGLAILLSPRAQELKSLLRVASGMLLGVGLSSFYLISALSQAKYFPVSRLPLWHNLDHHFLLRASTILHGGGMIRAGSLAAASTFAVCVLCSTVVLAKGSAESRKKVYFWLAPCIISIWMMSSASALVWRMCPALRAAIQYPGRFTIILCIASLPLLAGFLSEISRLPPLSQTFMFILLFVGIAPWFIAYRGIWAKYQWEKVPDNLSVNDFDGWFLAWPALGLDDASALRASKEPPVRFRVGSGSSDPILWKPRHIEIDTRSLTGGEIVVNQFYYPLWKASLIGNDQAIGVEPAMPEGILKISVPPGHQQVRLEIPVSMAEHVGRWISGLSALLSFVLATGIGFVSKSKHETAMAVTEAQ